jgi:hypothetical protein
VEWKVMNFKQLRRSYKTCFFWWDKLYQALWRELSQCRVTDEDAAKRREIETRLFEIDKLIKDFYSKKLGDAAINDARTEE